MIILVETEESGGWVATTNDWPFITGWGETPGAAWKEIKHAIKGAKLSWKLRHKSTSRRCISKCKKQYG